MTRYVPVAEIAKMIRKKLKEKFPGQKFSVRSSSYAGGASIRVGWMDGPTTSSVNDIINAYEGRGFDGSIDMAYCKTPYLLKDGFSVVYGSSQGSTGSLGYAEPYKNDLPEGAEPISSGASYVFAERSVSAGALEKAIRKVGVDFNNQFDVDGTVAAIKVDTFDNSAHISGSMGDKYVFDGSNTWDHHWSVGTRVREALSEMAF